MTAVKPVGFDSPSVTSYLTILQGVIGRMATNCAACKTWCITIVSAVVVIIADKGKPHFVWIAVIPIVLFLILDAYYLSLERQFRNVYNDFIRKLHFGSATVDDVFIIAPGSGRQASTLNILAAVASISVWPFYVLLGLMLLIVRVWIL